MAGILDILWLMPMLESMSPLLSLELKSIQMPYKSFESAVDTVCISLEQQDTMHMGLIYDTPVWDALEVISHGHNVYYIVWPVVFLALSTVLHYIFVSVVDDEVVLVY